jgi:hypothetical protein
VTPRRPIEVRQRERESYRESSLLPVGRLGVMYDSQRHGYVLFYIFLYSDSLKRFFLSVLSSNFSPWAPVSHTKAFLHMTLNS